jgi:hypothetical protein
MVERGDDDPLRVLSGFLTETTRHVRRTLLAVSTVAIATKALDVHVKTLSLLGTTIEITNERWLSSGLFFVVLYFLGMFLVYAFSDIHRSRSALTRITRMQPLLPGMALEYRDARSAAILLGFRALFDVFLPMVYGIFGLALLIQSIQWR